MKQAVIDTSVAIKWFFAEKGKDKALDLKNRHLKKKIFLVTRDLFFYEFTSAFKNYLPIKIEKQDFSLAINALRSIQMKIFPLEYQEMDELFTTSSKLDLSVYDSSYLILAKRLSTTLYTSDKKLFLKAKNYISSVFI